MVIREVDGPFTYRRVMMKKMGLLFCVFLCVAGWGAAQTKAELQEMYMTYLREQGYSPSLHSDGDVTFMIEGRNYYISVNETDPAYFRIVYPGFWEIESEEERRDASAVIMSVNRTTKLAKVYIEAWDNTYIDASVFLNTPQDFERHFSRMINTIQTARRKFIDEMTE
jgi:hypothetical protein